MKWMKRPFLALKSTFEASAMFLQSRISQRQLKTMEFWLIGSQAMFIPTLHLLRPSTCLEFELVEIELAELKFAEDKELAQGWDWQKRADTDW